MKSQVLSRFTEIWLPSTALILFLSVFIIMLIYVWKKSSLEKFKTAANLPFDEGLKDEQR